MEEWPVFQFLRLRANDFTYVPQHKYDPITNCIDSLNSLPLAIAKIVSTSTIISTIVVRHSRSWCDVSVNIKPAEETFNIIKKAKKFDSVSTAILSRLEAKSVKISCTLHKGTIKDTDQEENTNARKDCVR
jgi:hypothetical protein